MKPANIFRLYLCDLEYCIEFFTSICSCSNSHNDTLIPNSLSVIEEPYTLLLYDNRKVFNQYC